MVHDKNPTYAGTWRTPSGRRGAFFLFLKEGQSGKGIIEDELGIADVSEFVINDKDVCFCKDYICGRGAQKTIYYSGSKSSNERSYSGAYRLKAMTEDERLVDEIGSFKMEPFLTDSSIMNFILDEIEEKISSLFKG